MLYPLLWVRPNPDVENVPSLSQLDDELNRIYAAVMYGTSMEREAVGQTAIRVFGAGDKAQVCTKLAELRYDVVDEEVRRS